MSKKHKKMKYQGGKCRNDRKESKSERTVKYDKPKLKRAKLTLDKKAIKENTKLAAAPYKIPEKLLDNRTRCNHADGTMSVEAFRRSYPAASLITPMLDISCKIFGEENVHICKACYDIVVTSDKINQGSVIQALAILYAATGYVTSNHRMEPKEVRGLNKMAHELDDWNLVLEMMAEITEAEAAYGKRADTNKISLDDE